MLGTNYNHTPLISIIIPVFNLEKMIVEAIKSALGQTYKNIKVLVVDDGSTDRTFDVVSDFQDAVSVIRHSINKGQSSARNTGILSCNGEYVFFLDSDDYLEPDAIETLWTQLEPLTGKDEKWAVSYGKRLICDSDLNPVKIRPKRYASGNILLDLLLDNIVRTGTYLAKRTILQEVGGFREDLAVREDLLLVLSIATKYRFVFVDKYISKYRRHSGIRARDSVNRILLQGTKDLDYFYNNYEKSNPEIRALKSRVYAKSHKHFAKLAWRSRMFDLYLVHWRKMCACSNLLYLHPKYFLRALICFWKKSLGS